MPKINLKDARKIVDEAWNRENTPFARHVKPDSRGRYSVSVRADEFLFNQAAAFIVEESAKKAQPKVKFGTEEEIIFELAHVKKMKKDLNRQSNEKIKQNSMVNFNGYHQERYFAKIIGGKETTHNQLFTYVDDEQCLSNTARNHHFDQIRIQNRGDQERNQ